MGIFGLKIGRKEVILMKKESWKKKIKQSCIEMNTYQASFDSVIDTLAQILESRDSAHEQYVAEGSHPTIIHVNKVNQQNVMKNPLLTLEMDLNAQALAYWRELGLTVKAFKDVKGANEIKIDAGRGLEKLLEELG